MIGDKCLGAAFCAGLSQQVAEAIKKIAPIMVVTKDCAPFNTANNKVIKQVGDVESRLSGHLNNMSKLHKAIKQQRPHSLVCLNTNSCFITRKWLTGSSEGTLEYKGVIGADQNGAGSPI